MRTTLVTVLAALFGFGGSSVLEAQTLTYALKAGSSITSTCRGCAVPSTPPEPLSGSFDVTPLPIGGVSGVAAISNVQLSSDSFTVGGNGFMQRFADGHLALVLDARLNDDHALLTSGRSQLGDGHSIRAVLTSRNDQPRRFVVVLSLSPVGGKNNDADHDGVEDEEDNCATMPNADQRDDDDDGIGNPCDACSDGSTGRPVTADGCRLDQACPCHFDARGVPWEDSASYLRCVARTLRALRRAGHMSRGDAIKALREAGRAGCGRPVVAQRCPAALSPRG